MTPINVTLSEEILKGLLEQDPKMASKLLESALNALMIVERQNHIKAQAYQRSPERDGFANGFKKKKIKTRSGPIDVNVPQVRGSSEPFYPKCLEKGLRSERALNATLAQMYISGVSTRKVNALVKRLCGSGVSSSHVSNCFKALDEDFKSFRSRKFEKKYPILYLDAQYQKVRSAGCIRDACVLVAKGINDQGEREILGISTSTSEAELHWREFLEGLKTRGLSGVKLIVSDAHKGLRAGRQSTLNHVPWQRCFFHLQQNAQSFARIKRKKF